jgi:hypothetical protein
MLYLYSTPVGNGWHVLEPGAVVRRKCTIKRCRVLLCVCVPPDFVDKHVYTRQRACLLVLYKHTIYDTFEGRLYARTHLIPLFSVQLAQLGVFCS